jgi:ABC-2 type transport system permease protein
LISSKLILLLVGIYLLLFIQKLMSMRPPGDPVYAQTLYFYNLMHNNNEASYFTDVLLRSLLDILTFCGAFFGIVLGVFSISIERYGNTLNNLVAKPLYRDTIINGKLLGLILFLLSVFTFTIIVFTLVVMVSWGNSFIPLASEYFLRLPLVALLSLVYVLVFFAIALVISMVVADLAFALILGMTVKILLSDALTVQIAGKISTLMGWSLMENPLRQWTPNSLLSNIVKSPLETNTILNPTMDLVKAISEAMPNFAKLIIYVFILLVVSYSLFLRRDVS